MKADPTAQQILASGFLILCILLGMGGCMFLLNLGDGYNEQATTIQADK